MKVHRLRKNWKGLLGVGAVVLLLVALGVGGVVRAQAQDPAESPVVLHFTVDYDAQGVPSIMGVSASYLSMFGINAPVAMDRGWLQRVHDNNITQFVVQTKPSGVFMSVNGKKLPNVSWDGESLRNAVELLPVMGVYFDPQYANLITAAAKVPTLLDVSITLNFAPAGGQ